jgi:hypothetical protein
MPPDIMVFQMFVIACGTTIFVVSLRSLMRYLETRRQAPPDASHDLRVRLDRIERIVETTAIEVERIAEANRFMAKLLSDRSSIPTPITQPERVITPH